MPANPPVVAVTATEKDREGAPRVWLNAAYVRALEGAGLAPLVVPPLSRPELAGALLARVDGLLLTGGEDVDPAHFGAAMHPRCGVPHAARDATELALARAARDRQLPTLAICRGIQLLNVALGGTLVQDLPSERPGGVDHDPGAARSSRSHSLAVQPSSRLAGAIGASTVAVNSFHHQAVDRIADPLRVSARSDDEVVEGIETPPEHPWWVLAVQWHPEELTGDAEEWDRGIFRAFAERLRRGAG
jgi:putative glutamine amidotransferase